MKLLKVSTLVLLVFTIILGINGHASATLIANVTATATLSAGKWEYSYELTNDSTSTENIWVFTVYPLAEVFDIVTPPGWEWFFTDYLTFVKWPADPGYDLVPGGSLGGFGFKSFSPPVVGKYDVEGSDDHGYPTGTIYEGETLVPLVPEPGTIMLIGTGLIGLSGYFGLRRKSFIK